MIVITSEAEFFLDSELNKIEGRSVSSPSILLTVKTMISIKVMILPAGTHRRELQEGGNMQSKE